MHVFILFWHLYFLVFNVYAMMMLENIFADM